jgi:hypothetical protein
MKTKQVHIYLCLSVDRTQREREHLFIFAINYLKIPMVFISFLKFSMPAPIGQDLTSSHLANST